MQHHIQQLQDQAYELYTNILRLRAPAIQLRRVCKELNLHLIQPIFSLRLSNKCFDAVSANDPEIFDL